MRTRVLFLLFAMILFAPLELYGQVPSAAQMEMLRSMDPEQRAALLQQLGLDESMLDSMGAGDEEERSELDRAEPMGSERLPGDPSRFDLTLKPGDSVLVEASFIDSRPPDPVVPQQAANGAMPAPNLPPTEREPPDDVPTLDEREEQRLKDLIELIRAKNPYELGPEGTIQLPGMAPIALAGLTEQQATKRVAIAPEFSKLRIKVWRLPVRKTGKAALLPFGHELFKGPSTRFAAPTNIPVPADYIVGPGDQLNVQLYGGVNRNLRLIVGRDGVINFPELGPIEVAGRSFSRAAADIESRVARQMIGVRASVNMGKTRAIQVFVFGEVTRPGAYSVSGMATITSALYAAGGVGRIGSLRDVQLKRQGAVVRRFDLYDLLIRGDSSGDANLLPGDVVFVPPARATVTVVGEIGRPAIYELDEETSISEMVQLAGGLTAQADPRRASLVRINDRQQRVVYNLQLDVASGRDMKMSNGDELYVLRLPPNIDYGVTLEGHVFRPGPIAWNESMRLSNAIASVDELKPNADLGYVLVRRELPPDRRVVLLSADLSSALAAPGSPADIVLMPRDRIMVFDFEADRSTIIEPLLDELRRQSRATAISGTVRIDGRVKARGEYPLEPGMRVSDLLRAGGSLHDAAFLGQAELTRYRIGSSERETTRIEVDVAAILRGDPSADIPLQPYDLLNIKEVPEWSELEQVQLVGELRFPGTYPIKRGETLRQVLDRAGGLTSLAFASGAVFTRESLREREQAQLDRLAEQLQNDLATSSLRAAQLAQGQAAQALTAGQSLLSQLKTVKAVGRMVIDLQSVLSADAGSVLDIELRDGDKLTVPKLSQEVTVLGEVQNATSHFFTSNYTRDDYIALSGGFTSKADRDRVYVVRANGSVVSSEGAGWFRRSANVAIKPGDTIVAPLDFERMPPLPFWESVTQIIYNAAIAVAAFGAL